MSHVQTNFKAADMLPPLVTPEVEPGGTGGDEEPRNPAPDPAPVSPTPEPTQPQDDGSESGSDPNEQPEGYAVPSGSVADVLAWVGDDPERAQAAEDAENEKSKPRVSLLEKLEEVKQGS